MGQDKSELPQKRTRKPRMKARYFVFRECDIQPQDGTEAKPAHETPEHALAWIKANGQDGQTYVVLSQTRHPVTVHRKTVEKVSLT